MKIDVNATIRRIYTKIHGFLVDGVQVSPDIWYVIRGHATLDFVVAFLLYVAAGTTNNSLGVLKATGIASSVCMIIGIGVMIMLRRKKPPINRGHAAIGVTLIVCAFALVAGGATAYIIF